VEPSTAIFYVLASIALLSAVMVIWSRNAVHSAIYLVLSFLSIAAIYVLLQAEFVAAVQVMVYAGGIMVLFLFVIMLVNLKAAIGPRVRIHATISGALGLFVVASILYVYDKGTAGAAAGGQSVLRDGGNLQAVGAAIFQDYLLPFEIASVLLLVAMIGAIVLARQKI
jgi:NADH-quinone oxidoreductase subunit J